MSILYALLVASGFTLGFALFLSYLSEKWKVEKDPLVEKIYNVLPKIDCGACGYPGCEPCAEAIASGKAPINACVVGGQPVVDAVASIMGVEAVAAKRQVAVVMCSADCNQRLTEFDYPSNIKSCKDAALIGNNNKCKYGCLGFGDCVEACQFDAMRLVNRLPVIDPIKCTGCGDCVRACPLNIIQLVPIEHEESVVVKCSSRDTGKDVRSNCKTGCIACNICVRKGPEGLFYMEDNLAFVNFAKYDPSTPDFEEKLQVAIDKCPTKVIVRVGKETV